MAPNGKAAHGGNGNGNGGEGGPLFALGRDRVRRHTAGRVNARIDASTRRKLDAIRDDRDAIERRLAQLDREWDIDRALMTIVAGAGGAALALRSAGRGRLLFGALAVGSAFLLTHALLGWSAPGALLRRLGFRTQQEICAERKELLALLGEG